MSEDRWDGPDCGVDGCQREVGHIGDHRRVEEITPRSIDRASFGLTTEVVADFLRRNPEVAAKTEGRIHVGLDFGDGLDESWRLWDCPECGTRVATKWVPPETLDIERLRAIEKAAREAMRAGWFTTNDAGDRAADALRAVLGEEL